MRRRSVGSGFDVEHGRHGVRRHREDTTQDAEKARRVLGNLRADRAEREAGADELACERSIRLFYHDRSGLDDLLSS